MPSDPDASGSRAGCAAGCAIVRPVTEPGDRAGREQELSEIGVEGDVTPPQPFECHRRMLLLVVPVVGQDRRQALVRCRPYPLVVPVDRLELLAQ